MDPNAEPLLIMPREVAEEQLTRHASGGEAVLENAQAVRDEATFEDWNHTRLRWIALTETGLTRLYSTRGPAQEFKEAAEPSFGIAMDLDNRFKWDKKQVRDGINVLVSLQERLEFVDAPEPEETVTDENLPKAGEAQTVFIVHGRNEEIKLQVARLLEGTGSHPVTILHERPDEGRTLIEKFEGESSDAAFAIILFTGDDEGGAQGGPYAPRARQNVVFEHGFFVGKLGRPRVVVLYEQGVELPSDISGLVYKELDAGGAWRSQLLLELRSAGLDYDLNRLT